MRQRIKWVIITTVFLLVTLCTILFFLPTPPLLTGVSFSRAVYDDSQQLLRMTLSADDQYRLKTPLSQISSTLISATLLQEDQYFYWHYGVNPIAMLKAGWQTYVLRSRRMGSSTITMQVARLQFKLNSKTVTGKILQMLRAFQLEMHYSKKQILEAYLNLAPYGNNIEGVGAASLIYFNKPVSQLTLPEALTLAVIPQNPKQRAANSTSLKTIRNKLFNRWVAVYPQDLAQQSLINLPLQIQNIRSAPFRAPHFVNMVLQASSQSANIQTTLEWRLQSLLERIIAKYLSRTKNLGVKNAAVLLVDTRDWSIKALVGSGNFFDHTIGGQINGAEISRSPGSTLKPFIYGLALDQGLIHPSTILKDVPRSFGSYNPENFDYDFMGPIKAKDALVLSRNIPAIYLSDQLSHPNLYDLLESTKTRGLKSESFYGLTLALGGAEVSMLELSSLYTMLLNEGVWHPLRFLRDTQTQDRQRILSPEASFLVLDMLLDTPRPSQNTHTTIPVSWKTGTSSGYRDAWSIGAFGPYVLTVWLGNFDNTSNHAFVGKSLAAPLFFEIIEAITHEKNNLAILGHNPTGLNLTKINVCKASGLLPTRYCHDTESTWFIPGKSSIKTDTIYREVAVDKKSGLRTCHFDQNTQFKIFEFWPSDLLKIFKEAGIERRSPPAYAPDCSMLGNAGISPQITSLQNHNHYILQANLATKSTIPLIAVVDADVATLYWFLDEKFLGSTKHGQPLIWPAKPGKYVVRVVDDHGRSDAQDLVVELQ